MAGNRAPEDADSVTLREQVEDCTRCMVRAPRWLIAALTMAVLSAISLGAALGWVLRIQLPLRDSSLAQAAAEVRVQKQRVSDLEQYLRSGDEAVSGNVPVAVWKTGSSLVDLSVPPGARRVLLWADAPAGAKIYRITLSDAAEPVIAIGDLIPNREGVLVASLPVSILRRRRYTVQVSDDSSNGALLAQYTLRLRGR
ncbi:MAG TPA: hypothetical protein VG675_06335 [Bryobacteraceae bacterium]|nr:hypothetical protein [Bryobacteraceae bacterium]